MYLRYAPGACSFAAVALGVPGIETQDVKTGGLAWCCSKVE